MSIYAIADLHLSLNTDKPMDIFRNKLGKSWWKDKRRLDKKSKRRRHSTNTRRFLLGNIFRRYI